MFDPFHIWYEQAVISDILFGHGKMPVKGMLSDSYATLCVKFSEYFLVCKWKTKWCGV